MQTEGWIGRNGMGKTREGDGRTPEGEFTFLFAFGLQPSPGTALPYLHVDDSYYLVDDVSSQFYNELVSIRDVEADWNSAEHLAGMGNAYAYALVTDYNLAGKPGLGSGIFLHCEEGHPTAGCVAIPEKDMITILQRICPECRLICRLGQG